MRAKSYEPMKNLVTYDPDTGTIAWSDTGISVKAKVRYNRASILVGKSDRYMLNRLAWFLYHGTLPSGQIVHLNHDCLDFRITNLAVQTLIETSITKDYLNSILEYDPNTGFFMRKIKRGKGPAGVPISTSEPNRYIFIMAGRKQFLAHRLAWFWVHGEWPPLPLDHINGDRSDNRIANLRLATPSDNSCNSRPRHRLRSKYRGVYPTKDHRWRVRITKNGKRHDFGSYSTDQEAFQAREAVLHSIHGEFSRSD